MERYIKSLDRIYIVCAYAKVMTPRSVVLETKNTFFWRATKRFVILFICEYVCQRLIQLKSLAV